jgi:hypothetical protein
MSKCTDWEWDEDPMKAVEKGLEVYMDSLYSYVAEDCTEDIETESADMFCGCETCWNREVMAYLLPRFLDMYLDGQIRRWEGNDVAVQLVSGGEPGDGE